MLHYIKSLLPNFIQNWIKNYQETKLYNHWVDSNCPVPAPHIVKQKIIRSYQNDTGLKILVETGTYLGDMLEAQKNHFESLYSIELGQELYEKACQRFSLDHNIHIFQGDSGKVLPEVMKKLNSSAIFWLDGHYSAGITAKGDKECPIYEELSAILDSGREFNHVLLIDDARCFIGEGDYPTISDIKQFVLSKDSRYQLKVEHDVMRFTVD
jgi:hypothetical protein